MELLMKNVRFSSRHFLLNIREIVTLNLQAEIKVNLDLSKSSESCKKWGEGGEVSRGSAPTDGVRAVTRGHRAIGWNCSFL